jgi:aspartate racemase
MKTIGIVGGVGSYAGIELMKKICDYSDARTDQEHLPVHMISTPHKIEDRSKFLLNETNENPGDAIAEIISTLFAGGAEVIGIPCNTAHAPRILEKINHSFPQSCKLVHLIEEVGRYIMTCNPNIMKVGVLATNGTFLSDVYPAVLSNYGLDVVQPSSTIQFDLVHPAIYDPGYGIKAFSNPVSARAKANLSIAIDHLKQKGVGAVILGCTELSLAFGVEDAGVALIDSISVLAKALIRESKAT